ncbi:methyltransferase family protein [Ferrimonas aestuarii]|uniref:Isoprenylcysteine carboxylmethyltransferase family protein n=1 Tax=Ferrimonas aestuarii TaxID=2569539 RepID=A0A4U1BQN3_9GAMM|nr:isoprenylcysteine carboxylmethyltransferase family protein [Ferrimonas aestuarii]TKB57371.1 isoprenylcysteine carboxylmethyltransferase family protein [Ferrimonas aestuarii]
MKNLELKIPPVAVLLATAAVMFLVSKLHLCGFGINAIIRFEITGLLGFIAVVVLGLSVVAFREYRTTVNPMHPENTRHLVTVGIFRYSRNPMYLAMVMLLLAWACYLNEVLNLGLVALFIMFIQRFQILPEERMLEGHFGDEFGNYFRRTRRWL